MIKLEDSIEINIPLDELYNWLCSSNIFVVASCKLSLVSKENPTRQLMPILALIELPLYGSTQFWNSQVA